jgi:hypothetical protein
VHTAKPLVHELIQVGVNNLCSEIHILIHCIWNKKELPWQWKEYIIVPIYKQVIEEYHYLQLHTEFYSIFLSQG